MTFTTKKSIILYITFVSTQPGSLSGFNNQEGSAVQISVKTICKHISTEGIPYLGRTATARQVAFDLGQARQWRLVQRRISQGIKKGSLVLEGDQKIRATSSQEQFEMRQVKAEEAGKRPVKKARHQARRAGKPGLTAIDNRQLLETTGASPEHWERLSDENSRIAETERARADWSAVLVRKEHSQVIS